MKKALFVLSLLIFFSSLSAQKWSPTGRIFLHEIQPLIKENRVLEMPVRIQKRYDLYYKNGYWYAGVLALVNQKPEQQLLDQYRIKTGAVLGDLYSLRVPVQFLDELEAMPCMQYMEAGADIGPDLDRSRFSTRADSVHQGLGGLNMPYTGKGVVIGIIDWGFDYTHPVFYDTLFQEYRVARAWDQIKSSGPAPQGFDFGTEYIGKDALLAAQQDTLYVFGPGSHGTHVGGIAGGSGAGNTRYRGIAPEAELVFVSLKRDDPSFVDAITYISRYADAVGKPMVINMSFGGQEGPHDGTGLRSKAINMLAGKGKALVSSAGNNGGEFLHVLHRFPEDGDTLKTVVNFASGLADYYGQTVAAWGTPGEAFEIALLLADNQNNILYQSPFYSTANSLLMDQVFYANGNDSLVVRWLTERSNQMNFRPNMNFRIRKTGNNKLVLLARSEGGQVHFWNMAELNSRTTNWGFPFQNNFPGARQGDPNYSISDPQGVSREVITVASHRGEVLLPNGQINLGQISAFSSYGPTVDERRKPDISGPGQDVASSVNSFDPGAGTPVATYDFNGRTYTFVRYSGTSMSGPAVAGVVALMFQANPRLTAQEIKTSLKITARLDQHTGAIGDTSSLVWGWGKANALAAVKLAELKLSIPVEEYSGQWSFYPNPCEGKFTVQSEQELLEIKVMDMSGREINTVFYPATGLVELQESVAGTCLVLMRTSSGWTAGKLIVVK